MLQKNLVKPLYGLNMLNVQYGHFVRARLHKLNSIKLIDWVFIIVFLIGPVASGIIVGSKMFSTYLPVGDDPGNWLKRINAFMGNLKPLWNENLLSYPPLFHLIGAVFSLIFGDAVTGLKVLTLVVFSSIPITSGWFAFKLSNRKEAAAAASLITSFLPMHYEMIWWGAYPNLLGMALLPVTLYIVSMVLESGSTLKNILLMVLASSAIALTHHISAVVFACTLVILCVLLMLMRMLSIRFGLGAITSITIIAAYITYLIKFGYLINNPTIAHPDLYERMLWGFKNPIILYTLSSSSVLGIIVLVVSWRYITAITLSAWILSPLIIASSQYIGIGLDVGRIMLFLGVPMVISSTIIMPRLTELGRIVKKEDEQEYSAEIDVGKVLPVILMATALVLCPVTALSTNQAAYDYYEWLSRDYGRYLDGERMKILDWIRENTSIDDVIVSGYHLGRWIEGYAVRRVLMDIPLSSIAVRDEFYRSLTAQAILQSNYEVANGYFFIADQSPIAPTFAPLISVSHKWGYDQIIYLDDSFVRFNFTRGGRGWIEAPFKSWLSHLDVSEESGVKKFKLTYQTHALRINKTLEIGAGVPYFTLRYDIVPNAGIALREAEISFFLAWGKIIKEIYRKGNGFRLSTQSSEIIVEFNKNVSLVEAGVYEEFNQHRVYVKLPLNSSGDSFTIIFRNPDTSSFYPQNWFTSFKKALEDFRPRYIVTFKEHLFHKSRSLAPSYPEGEIIYIDDAFARVSFFKAGALWREAPYKAKVIDEENLTTFHRVVYETIALNIYKEITDKGDSLTIYYKAEPKPGVEIVEIEVPIWISWGRSISYANGTGNQIILVTDAGSIIIKADEGASIDYGLDPEFKAQRVLIKKKTVDEAIDILIEFKPLNYLSHLNYKYTSTTRPIMEGGDRVDILNEIVKSVPVFETENLVIYRIEYPR